MSKNVFDVKPDSQKPPNDQQNYATGNDVQTVKRYVCNLVQGNIVAFSCIVFQIIFLVLPCKILINLIQNETQGGNDGRNNQTRCHS